jgi:acyl-CoA synthetase (AMP-forming)/AMP-acid ligase II
MKERYDVGGPELAMRIPDFLGRLAEAYGATEAVCLGPEVVTYEQLDGRSAALARGLLARGVGKATRVGLLLGNGPEWVTWWAAVTRIGAIAVPLSTFARPGELERTIRHADLHGLVMQREHLGRVLTEELERAFPALLAQSSAELRIVQAPHLRWVLQAGEDPSSWARVRDWLESDAVTPELLEAAEAEVHGDDLAMIIYTSGTSATPKGVTHTQHAIMSKVHYLRRMLAVPSGADAVALMPFFWVGGLVMSLLTTLEAGGRVECTAASSYSAPPLGSAAAQQNPFEHLPLCPALGMTETFGMYSWGRVHRADGHTIASPLDVFEPGYSVAVVGTDGLPVADGDVGEIVVRGPTVTRQLVKVANLEAFDVDGYLRTGDRGMRDGERIHFVGRLGDMIKTSGANVAPPEVEREIVGIDGIEAAFVTGVDDPDRGQEVVAAVVCRLGVEFDAEAVRAHLRTRLSPYKVPRRLISVSWDQLPTTPSQKVDRRALARLIDERARAESSPG